MQNLKCPTTENILPKNMNSEIIQNSLNTVQVPPRFHSVKAPSTAQACSLDLLLRKKNLQMSQILQNFVKFQKFQLDNLVDFEKCCKTHIYLQKSVPIQPKTSNILPKFCQKLATTLRVRRACRSPHDGHRAGLRVDGQLARRVEDDRTAFAGPVG